MLANYTITITDSVIKELLLFVIGVCYGVMGMAISIDRANKKAK